MLTKFLKYRENISIAVITAYLFLSIFNLYHHHTYDFQAGNYSYQNSDETKAASLHFQNTGLGIQCTFAVNFALLHNFNDNNSNIFSADVHSQELPEFHSLYKIISHHHSSISLRAPPAQLL